MIYMLSFITSHFYSYLVGEKMNQTQEKALIFRSIVQDDSLHEKDIEKFLKWGKGSIEQSLNYYYQQKEKGKLRKTKPKLKIPSDADSEPEERSDYFSKLKEGSIKQRKTQQFIDKVRQDYMLPIQGRSQEELIKKSQSRVSQKHFKMADCLPELNSIENFPLEATENNGKSSSDEENLEAYEYTQIFPKPLQKEEKQKKQKGQPKVIDKKQLKKQALKTEGHPVKVQKRKKYPRKTKEKVIKSSLKVINQSESYESESEKFEPEQKCLYSQDQIHEIGEYEYQKGLKISQKHAKKEEKVINATKSLTDENNPFKQKMEDFEIYVGEYPVNSLSARRRNLEKLQVGDRLEIKSFIEQGKKKKGFSKRVEKHLSMYIMFKGEDLGRINNDDVNILLPLIDEGLIRVEFYAVSFPRLVDTFTSILLKAKVFFNRKLITEPIAESYEPLEKDKEKVHQISALLTKLSLNVKTEPLVKGKSKYIRNKKSTKNESIDMFRTKKEQIEKKRQEFEKKRETEIKKSQNDLNYKPIQKNILQMMGRAKEDRKSGESSEIQNKECEQKQVEKKVIQIDDEREKDKFSELLNLQEENIVAANPSSDFLSQLYPYQALALGWMLKREGFKSQNDQIEELHPLWTEYELVHTPQYRLFFNQLTGQVSVRRPLAKTECRGGILADEMGLGKTIMMISLMVTHKPKPNSKKNMGSNLIILPLTLLSQWESEIEKHSKNLKVLTYYSTDRQKHAGSLGKFDVVLTTYGTVSHEFAKCNHITKAGLYKYKWHRIILDEAHYIKGRIIQTSKAVYQLVGDNKWCLTGTPIQNSVADLFSLIHFIKYTPWSEFACWNRFFAKPLEDGDESIYGVLRVIMKKIFLRRTKNSEDETGKPIIQLPARISKVQLLKMSQSERAFYDSVYMANKMEINDLLEKGILEAKYMEVLEMLMRLRQICCHPILFKSVANFIQAHDFQTSLKKFIQKSYEKKIDSSEKDQYFQPIINADNEQFRVKSGGSKVNDTYFQEVMVRIREKEFDPCLICLYDPQDPVITPCLHIFCKPCAVRQIQEKGFCASCREKLTREDYLHLPRENRLNISEQKSITPSTKMKALLQHVKQMKSGDKAVVFSQFLGMLDLLEAQMKKCKIGYVRMEGSNSHRERKRIVNSFQNDPKVTIFLVSLKTAGVGLNLVAANKVFMMDPWWNPAVEEQAIERVHRIGQKRQVEIIRFITDKTIQTRMLQLNTQKKTISQNVLTNSKDDHQSGVNRLEKLKYLMENY